MALVHLAGIALVQLLLIAAPFLAAGGGIYWLLASTHDINYYLARKPPAVLGRGGRSRDPARRPRGVFVWKIAGWIAGIARLVLFDGVGGSAALEASRKTTGAHRRKLTVWLFAWLGFTALASGRVTRLWVGGRTSQSRCTARHLSVLLIALGLVIIVAVLANLAVSVFTTVLFPLFVVRLYRSMAGPGELRPEIAVRGSLGNRAAFGFREDTSSRRELRLAAVAVVGSCSGDRRPRLGGAGADHRPPRRRLGRSRKHPRGLRARDRRRCRLARARCAGGRRWNGGGCS